MRRDLWVGAKPGLKVLPQADAEVQSVGQGGLGVMGPEDPADEDLIAVQVVWLLQEVPGVEQDLNERRKINGA